MPEQLFLQGQISATVVEHFLEQADALGQRLGWSATTAWQVRLILEELLVNILRHGSGGSNPIRVELTITQLPSVLEILLCDDGIAFDPLQLPKPELMDDVTQRSVGGLGVFLVRSLTASLRYQRIKNQNCLWVYKALA